MSALLSEGIWRESKNTFLNRSDFWFSVWNPIGFIDFENDGSIVWHWSRTDAPSQLRSSILLILRDPDEIKNGELDVFYSNKLYFEAKVSDHEGFILYEERFVLVSSSGNEHDKYHP